MPMVVSDAVQRLVKGRASREAATPLSETAPDLTLAQGYAIQRALEKTLVEGGDRVIGWKAGLTNAALQETYGVAEPVLGFLLASGVFGSGDAVPVSRFTSLGLEVEMAFVFQAR
jgi:2-keto-4-pentenoate hydratase